MKFAAAALCGAVCFGFASCSDDEDPVVPAEPGVENVFPAGVSTEFNGAKITTNADGKVIEIKSDDETATFEYGTFSRATDYQVKMTLSSRYGYGSVIYMQLNDKGFVSHAVEVYDGGGEDETWDLGYNGDGQLNYMKRSDNEEVTTFAYTNGDVTKVTSVDEDGDSDNYTIAYTSTKVSTAIENKGGIMLFEDLFQCDMDNIEIAYYAGLLGKATKHLPVSCTEEDGHYEYDWTLNAAGLPTLMNTYWFPTDGESSKYDEITFKW